MKDITMNEEIVEPTAAEAVAGVEKTILESQKHALPWYRRFWIPIGIIVLVGVPIIMLSIFKGRLVGLNQSDPSVSNLVMDGFIVLGVMLLSIWFFLGAPLSWKIRRNVTLIGFAILAGFIASIEWVEFSGSMEITIHYRWEGNNNRVLEEQEKQLAKKTHLEIENLIRPEEMPAYRGLKRDGIVVGPQLRVDWKANPLKEIWRKPLGGGYASFAVAENFIVTIEQRRDLENKIDNEAITCYSAKTGEIQWLYEYPAKFFEAMGGTGPRTTPTIHEGKVYSVGGTGNVVCLDFASGNLIWSHNMLDENDIPNVIWGMSSSPLIVDDKVIVNPGGPEGNGLLAYDKITGKEIWKSEGTTQFSEEKIDGRKMSINRSGYSSPVLVEIAGVRQIVLYDGVGVGGYDVDSGKRYWFFKHENQPAVSVAQPVFLEDNQILVCSGYDVGSAMFQVKKEQDGNGKNRWTVEEKWRNARALRCKFTSPVLHQGFVYGLHDGIMMCIDPYTGKIKWKRGRFGNGQILITGDQILIMGERGDLTIVQANPEKFIQLARQKVLEKSAKVWNPHALVDGRVYVRDHIEMACFDLKQ